VHWMSRALELARRGIGLCSPNPQVGCVILDSDGVLAGQGWHEYDKLDHAEVFAIREAGERARGGTAYVTLEPCNHTGRTGPCSQALIAAGVTRVVAATVDPNALVAGQGLETLRTAGIAVETGVLQAEARRLNEGFARWIQTRRPLVLMKVAMTLDGKIAPAAGLRGGLENKREPYWITGEASRAAVQEMRWAADAVLTGVETVIADDPLLTDRSGHARRRPLLRVVLDSALRMPLDSKLVHTAHEAPVVLFTVMPPEGDGHATQLALKRIDELRAPGVRVEVVAAESGRVSLNALLDTLGAAGILTLLTETGARLNTALLDGGFVDRLRVFSSPQIYGSEGLPAFRGLSTPVRLENSELERFGEDVSVSGLLRDPWASTTKPPYTLGELLAESDFSKPLSPEEQEWLDAPSVGDESI
jgi:diaminohydroxyphosphoribosylaminopyrimidine deaminase / 5-amino-6-(5-phosphoribosylamino)uracil reductase